MTASKRVTPGKTRIAGCGIVLTLFLASFNAQAGVIAGPITNSDNGNEYYLLTPNTWTASEAEAEGLGGTLAVIRNPNEQKWIFSTFGGYGSVRNRNLWIGLRRERQGGPLAWVTGAPVTFTNWSRGEPDNCGGNEAYVHIWSSATEQPGEWNDAEDGLNLNGSAPNGVVEVRKEKLLSETEKSLIGTWYEGGRIDRACYFAATTNLLFAIGKFGRSARIIDTSETTIFAASWHIRGEIEREKILWTDGTWWSRKVSDYTPETLWSGAGVFR
jgi:Lectin C-type domain